MAPSLNKCTDHEAELSHIDEGSSGRNMAALLARRLRRGSCLRLYGVW